MEKYRAHKEVWAGKIVEAVADSLSDGFLIQIDGDEEAQNISDFEFQRIKATVRESGHSYMHGHYFVIHHKGTDKEYVSWSPADVFEARYSVIQPSSGQSSIKGDAIAKQIDEIDTILDMEKEFNAQTNRMINRHTHQITELRRQRDEARELADIWRGRAESGDGEKYWPSPWEPGSN